MRKSRDRQTKESQSEPVPETPPDPATYVPTGNLEQDLPVLCLREDVRAATVRLLAGVKAAAAAAPPEPAAGAAAVTTATSAAATPAPPTGKGGRKAAAAAAAVAAAAAAEQAAMEAQAEEELLADPSATKTYKEVDLQTVIQRVFHVRHKCEEDKSSVEELRIAKWRLTTPYLNVLLSIMPLWKQLTCLQLVNTQLSSSGLAKVIQCLQENTSATLRRLCLDGNALIEPASFTSLLREPFCIRELSLRAVGCDDSMCAAAKDHLTNNTSLRILDLSLNRIGDDGAIALAKALRFNRALLMLSLIGNNIGDDGASALAEMLQMFELSHEEVVLRRKTLSSRRVYSQPSPDPADGKRSSSSSEPTTKSPPSATAFRDALKSSGKVKKEPAGKTLKPGKEEKPAKKDPTLKKTKGGKVMSTGSRKSLDVSSEAKEVEPHCAILDDVEPMDGKLWCFGNLTLASLNLTENRHMTEASARTFLEALKYQAFACRERKAPRQGVLRLCISPRHVPPDILQESEIDAPSEIHAPMHGVWQEISDLLSELDPVKQRQHRQEELRAAQSAAAAENSTVQEQA